MRAAVMASGRGSNFDALQKAASGPGSPFSIAVVLCDRAQAPVLERARGLGIPAVRIDPGTRRGAWAPAGVRALEEALHEHRVDAVCLAGFMRILPAAIVQAFAGRILNVHPSLLPAFPGLRPHRQALRAGVRVSGCTVHLVDEGVDTGPILLQAAVPVLEGDTEDSLAARVLEQEHRIYPEAVRALAEGRVRIQGRRVHLSAPTVTGT
ncbi:MAG TPA: phosphoribosylglycinamide formyltransferase [bacterium]|nr:phosphoribosylglycinamide formyltransferase [bacterium]